MKRFVDLFRPCLPITKAWLVNLSVASFAVGLFQKDTTGLGVGFVLLLCALLLAYVKDKE